MSLPSRFASLAAHSSRRTPSRQSRKRMFSAKLSTPQYSHTPRRFANIRRNQATTHFTVDRLLRYRLISPCMEHIHRHFENTTHHMPVPAVSFECFMEEPPPAEAVDFWALQGSS